MSEATPEATPAQETPPSETDPSTEPKDWQAEATRLREELTKARKWEERAKENSAAAKAAEKARLDAMSESERAVEEARQAARSEATLEFGKRLARSEFDAIAGRRNPDFDTSSALEYVDLAKFVGEDGEPDKEAIKSAVERLVPAPANALPEFDGGSRTTATAPQGMSQLIRKAAGRA